MDSYNKCSYKSFCVSTTIPRYSWAVIPPLMKVSLYVYVPFLSYHKTFERKIKRKRENLILQCISSYSLGINKYNNITFDVVANRGEDLRFPISSSSGFSSPFAFLLVILV